MRHDSVYTSKNVFLLVGLFLFIFLLLYSLASFLHESQKINREIEAIHEENQKALAIIEEKKQQLQYLETPQRVDKEAKIQMGRRQEGENVLVFLEDPLLPMLPSELSVQQFEDLVTSSTVPAFEKWNLLFFGPRNVFFRQKVLQKQPENLEESTDSLVPKNGQEETNPLETDGEETETGSDPSA
ncbi:MAG: hypothetical protein K9M51_02145 [Candidatus Gracilibacteria bacterium]|nr:hypothetical protein [Candidatus Gracilibacteria bacterium]